MTSKSKTSVRPACWCGGSDLTEFSPDYGICSACGTLVRLKLPTEDLTTVSDLDSDLYGRGYYEHHLVEDLNQPDIFRRMRQDLPERTLHWLRTVQKYCPPGGAVLEIGCGHGAALALFEASGFKAIGVELSPWLVELARQTWQVDVRVGPVERQDFAAASFDAIALFDVLEHLQNPIATLQTCAQLLKPDGVLIVQTPEHRPARTFADIEQSNDPFRLLLIPEHLYLFTRDSVQRLFDRVGLPKLVFEPAVFAHYDQYFVAARRVPESVETTAIEAGMKSSVAGRLTQAMLDLKDQVSTAGDNAPRLHELGRMLQQRDRDLERLDEQLARVNALARVAADSHLQHLSALEAQRKELESLLAQRQSEIESLHHQLAQLNESAQAQLAAKEQALLEIDRQLGTVNELARAQAQEANSSLAELNDRLRTCEARAAELLQNGSALQSRDSELRSAAAARLHRAHTESTLANHLLATLEPPSPAASPWSPLPLAWARLPPSSTTVLHNIEVCGRNHDMIRISGWASARHSGFCAIPPLLLVAGRVQAWSMSGTPVPRPDVVEAYPATEHEPAPVLACGFVFEFSPARLPAGCAAEVRVCCGIIDGLPCLTPPFALPV